MTLERKIDKLLTSKKKAKREPEQSRSDFLWFIENTLIPDLRDSGSEGYVEDFETALRLVKRGEYDANFIDYLDHTIIPDTVASGRPATASDLRRFSRMIKQNQRRGAGKRRSPRQGGGKARHKSGLHTLTLKKTGSEPWYFWRGELPGFGLRIIIQRIDFSDLGYVWEIFANGQRIAHGTTYFHAALEAINGVMETQGYRWRVTATPLRAGGKRRKANLSPHNARLWKEYDMAAMWCAKRGLTGKPGDPLPNLMGADTVEAINADPEAFEERVRMSAYAQAMERHGAGKGRHPRLGSGGRFTELAEKIKARGGVRDPRAVAASIGIRKYGAKKMRKLAVKGRKRALKKRYGG